MSTRFRPLILWEAPGDDILDDFAKEEAGADKKDPAAKSPSPSPSPGKKDPAKPAPKAKPPKPPRADEEDPEAEDPPEDAGGEAPADDGAEDGGAGDGGEDSLPDDEDGEPGADDPAAAPSDTVGDRLRREQLLNEIESIRDQAKSLERSLAFLADRASEASARTMAATSRKIVEEAARQCSVILINFSDLGYDRVLTVFRTVRERVSAVAEIVKHVIDGDDDFRDSRSGATERDNGPPSGRA